MKHYECGTTIIIIISVVGLIGFMSSRILGNDNPIEELAEEIIENETGINLDLSPSSKEDKLVHGCHP